MREREGEREQQGANKRTAAGEEYKQADRRCVFRQCNNSQNACVLFSHLLLVILAGRQAKIACRGLPRDYWVRLVSGMGYACANT
jgi:hypothetical protein